MPGICLTGLNDGGGVRWPGVRAWKKIKSKTSKHKKCDKRTGKVTRRGEAFIKCDDIYYIYLFNLRDLGAVRGRGVA